ncbi:MAG: ATP-dependent DNA ligase [Candidatus Aenigmatarchaeota archaeon]
MRYSKLCSYYERLEDTTKNLEMRDIVAELLGEVSSEELETVTLAAMGKVFPSSVNKDIGIAGKLMQNIISKAYGVSKDEVVEKFKETGDLGKTAEYFCENKRQRSLMQKQLTVDKVFKNLRRLPETSGTGSEERKRRLVKELLVSADPLEARYVVRTTLQEMRIGVGEGTVRDAIAKAFDVPKDKVEKAFFKITDYGKVARIAMEEGVEGLEGVEIEVGRPLRMMLAEISESLEQAIESYENPALEIKLDGFRGQIHKKGEDITLFSRRLEDKTKQFPEVVEWAKECLRPEECIVDCEIVAVDEKGEPLVFQNLSKRIQRKYDIERMRKEIPVQVNCFDLFYVDGENYMSRKLSERWKKLSEIVDGKEGKFRLVEHMETKDLEKANSFYQKALRENQEGIMVKNMDAVYQPGKRVGYWKKVKETMEPLDLVIVEGIWGEGKRSNWISSLMLAVRDPDTGEFLTTGKMATGMTEEELEEVTEKLQDLIIEEDGRRVKVRPELVVEVGYEEIQKSPKYETGYALRFPRLLRFRYNKSIEEADDIERLKSLYRKQNN